jgi:iron complex transport system permease protein
VTADPVDRIVWTIRLPRVLLAALAGGGLSIAGATLQACIRNPLADPYVLGVSQGASVGAVVVIVFGSAALGGIGPSGAAFAGALLATGAVFLLGRRAGQFSPIRLLLSGVALGYLCVSVTSFLELKTSPQNLSDVVFWLLGSVVGAQWNQLAMPAALVFVATVWLLLQGRRLNVLLIGDESASALGVGVNAFRAQLLVASSLLTAAIVAVAGGIGFVGLMVPHAARLIVGPDHRKMLPVAVLMGASYLVLVDLLGRLVGQPGELPLGIFTAAVGVPFFLVLLVRSRRVGGGT